MSVPYIYLTSESRRHKSHSKKTEIRKRCARMVKQQKTRFYILGRCISMLLCWHDHDMSD
ncbi:hypothetical protein AB3S75_019249 [Citrus x aurantiifolia]